MSEKGRTRRSRIPHRQPTGLYVHSSPPTAVPVHPSVVRQWLRGGEIERLTDLVLQGQGATLVGEYSPDSKARAFINSLPRILRRVEELHEAGLNGRINEVENVLKKEPRFHLELSRDSGGLGLLHKAVIHNHEPLQDWLIENYPETVHVLDKEKRIPLHYAGGNATTWNRLAEAGADTQAVDSEGNTPAFYMLHPRRLRPPLPDTRGKKQEQGLVIKPSNIRIWIHDKDLGRLQKVLWEGMGDRLKTETSTQPLVRRFLNAVPYIMGSIREVHTAAVNNDLELLMSRSSDPVPKDILLSKDANGLTPLHKAAGLGNMEIVQEILRRAPEAVHAKDCFDRTPLHYAAGLRDQNAMYQLLVDAGAVDHLEDKKGNTPSYYKGKPADLEGGKYLTATPEAPRTAHIFPPSWDWRLLSKGSASVTASPVTSPQIENNTKPGDEEKEAKIEEAAPEVEREPDPDPEPEPEPESEDPEVEAVTRPEISEDEGVGSEFPASAGDPLSPQSDVTNEEFRDDEFAGARLGETITFTRGLFGGRENREKIVGEYDSGNEEGLSAEAQNEDGFSETVNKPINVTENEEKIGIDENAQIPNNPDNSSTRPISGQKETNPSRPGSSSNRTESDQKENTGGRIFLTIRPGTRIDNILNQENSRPSTSSLKDKENPIAQQFEEESNSMPESSQKNASSRPVSGTITTENIPSRPVSSQKESSQLGSRPVSGTITTENIPSRPVSSQQESSRSGSRPVSGTIATENFPSRPVSSQQESSRSGSRPVSGTIATENIPSRPVSSQQESSRSGTPFPKNKDIGEEKSEEPSWLESNENNPTNRPNSSSNQENGVTGNRISRSDFIQEENSRPGTSSLNDMETTVAEEQSGEEPINRNNSGEIERISRPTSSRLISAQTLSRPNSSQKDLSDVVVDNQILEDTIVKNQKDELNQDANYELNQNINEISNQNEIESKEVERMETDNNTVQENGADVKSPKSSRPPSSRSVSSASNRPLSRPSTVRIRPGIATRDEKSSEESDIRVASGSSRSTRNADGGGEEDDQKPETVLSAGGSRAEILAITPAPPDTAEDSDTQKAVEEQISEEEKRQAEELVKSGDMEAMAEMVLSGQGSALLGLTSENPDVQLFINNVPQYMAKIDRVHKAAREGDLRGVQTSLDRRKFAVARDNSTPLKPTPLHVAALFGRTSILRYLAGRFPETMHALDAAGRSALHYTATLPDNGHFYSLLVTLGANKSLVDNAGKTAEQYLRNRGELTRESLLAEYQDRAAPIDTSGLNFNRYSDKVANDNVSSRQDVDDYTIIAQLEASYLLIQTKGKGTLLHKLFREDIFEELKYRSTRLDNTLVDLIRPGVKDLAIGKGKIKDKLFTGLEVPDYESYRVFEDLIMPVVKEMMEIPSGEELPEQPPRKMLSEPVEYYENLNVDPTGYIIKSFVVEMSRNLSPVSFPKNLKLSDLEKVEVALTSILTGYYRRNKDSGFIDESGENFGSYYSLSEVVDNNEVFQDLEQEALVADGIDDPNSENWPYGRGVFISPYGDITAWINIREHLKVFSVTSSDRRGHLGQAYKTAVDIISAVDDKVESVRDPILGLLVTDPRLVGNTLYFNILLSLPNLAESKPSLRQLCKQHGLHLQTTSNPTHFRLRNKACLGLAEFQSFNNFVDSIGNIIEAERSSAKMSVVQMPNLIKNFLRKKSSKRKLEN